jgi:large subunit ribosomal protein L21
MARAVTTKPTKAPKKETKKNAEFAVILSGGKQYVVSVGDIVDVERLSKEYKEGDVVEFDKVLLVDNGTDATIGTPYIDGAKVKAIYQGGKKGKKLSIVRFKAKSNRDRKIGHRQKYDRVKIESL